MGGGGLASISLKWDQRVRASMAGPALAPWQWGVLALCYVVFFVLPSFWMAKRARRDGENAFIWTSLVLVGSFMGIYEYYHHLGIQKSRARKAAKRRAERAEGGEGAGSPSDPPLERHHP